jgi:hypothetical protein
MILKKVHFVTVLKCREKGIVQVRRSPEKQPLARIFTYERGEVNEGIDA